MTDSFKLGALGFVLGVTLGGITVGNAVERREQAQAEKAQAQVFAAAQAAIDLADRRAEEATAEVGRCLDAGRTCAQVAHEWQARFEACTRRRP